jgi:cytochrome c peroxidase
VKTLVSKSIALFAFVFLLCAQSSDVWVWEFPAWVPTPVVPVDNPMTRAKVELGRHLFYDKRLSLDQSMSCATCHEQSKAFTDGRARSIGLDGKEGFRSAMSLANAAYSPVLTWSNPLLTSLEVQALLPIFGDHPVEMAMTGREQELLARLLAEPRYGPMFESAFPELVNGADDTTLRYSKLFSLSTLTKALASFQRSLCHLTVPTIATSMANKRMR